MIEKKILGILKKLENKLHMNENEFYGVFRKEKVDELKIQIDNILDGKNTSKEKIYGLMKYMKKIYS